eukprot:snap_masked-scaffold_48-processed-gene-1.103-mRNA-1 protein AED:0.43 eAED:0.43 QI:0/-1/0/1/-1/1/1/0/585
MKFKTLSLLGDGWLEKYDVSHKRKFYYNRRSRKSTWTKPEIDLKPPGHDKQKLVLEEDGDRIKARVPQPELSKNQDWVKIFSEEHQRSYYFNKLSQTSVWDNSDLQTSDGGFGSNAEEKENANIPDELKSVSSTQNNDDFTVKYEYQPRLSPSVKAAKTSVENKPSVVLPERRKIKKAGTNLIEEYEVLCKYVEDIKARQKDLVENNSDQEVYDELENFAKSVKEKANKLVSKLHKKKKQMEKEMKNQNKAQSSCSDIHVELPNTKDYNNSYMSEEFTPMLTYESEVNNFKDDFKAIEAERKAKEQAKEKYEQIKLLKNGKGDYYKLLGVEKGATGGQLKKAYFKLMIRYHPDKRKRKAAAGEFDEDLTERETTERSNLVKDAYKVLGDKWERSLYDHLGLEDYLIHSKTLGAFVNYIISGLKLKKHGRKDRRLGLKFSGKLSYYPARHRFLWLNHTRTHINTGPVRILEPQTPQEIKSIKGVKLTDIVEIKLGINTDVFKRTGLKEKEETYFSIVSKERSIDMECVSKQQRDFLASRINLLRCCEQKDFEEIKKHYEKFPIKKKPKAKTKKKKPPPPPPKKKKK